MKMLSRQEIFDKVVTHLLVTQKAAAISPVGSCCYRDNDGRSCAIGCLIPDELYHREMEGFGAATLRGRFDAVFSSVGVDLSDTNFLNELQSVHDLRAYGWVRESLLQNGGELLMAAWAAKFYNVAALFQLEVNVLKAAGR